MPATTLVCPHCEKTVEIQVSSVTRSRTCPECGEVVMLQMAEKSTRTKRRALLVGQGAAPAEEEGADAPKTAAVRGMEPSHEPMPIAGDAFDRMKHDPEVLEARRTLMIGLGVVSAIILVLVVVNLLKGPSTTEAFKAQFGDLPDMAKTESKGSDEPAVTREDLQQPVDPNSLVFRPPGEKQLKSGAAATVSSMSADLAKLAAGQEVVEKFLQAATWQERLAFVRNGQRVEGMMRKFYEQHADGPTSFDSLVEATELPGGFTEHTVVLAGGGRKVATVQHTSQGGLVDWEAFVGAGEMGWSEFITKRQVQPATFRVFVSPAGHYENSFGYPQSLKCYSLRNISEPGAKVIYGYLDRHSAMAREIDFWLEKNRDETVPMILSLKFPLEAPVDFQVWIQGFVQAGWVIR
ncbi:MAG: hypothetical protein R3F13_03515 [Prosthecobacter sp.]